MLSNQKRIIDSINVYVKEKKSDYALMINGSWGSGKTYFVKNKLIPKLPVEKPVIYISLFGIKTVEDLINVIGIHILNIYANESAQKRASINNDVYAMKNVNASVSMFPSMLAGIISKGLNLISNGVEIKSLVSNIQKNTVNFTKYIFIFDDFERSVIDKIELLGIFDEMVEQNNAKVIIVCNEMALLKKVDEKDVDASEQNEDINTESKMLIDNYNLYKEKVVGLTIKYETDLADIYQGMLNDIVDINSKAYSSLIEYKDDVLELFARVNSNNLRTLIFIIKRFEELAKKIELLFDENRIDKGYLDKYQWYLLCNITAVSIMYKDFGDFDILIPSDRDVVIKPFLSEGFSKGNMDFNINSYIRITRAVNQYLYEYSLDKELLLEDIKRYIREEEEDTQKITDRVSSIFYLENDNEAIAQLEAVIDDIKEDRYSLEIYPRMLGDLFTLIGVLYNDRDSKLELVKKHIITNVKCRAEEFSESNWHYFGSSNTNTDDFNRELHEIAKTMRNELKKEKFIEILDDGENFTTKFRELVEDSSAILGEKKSMLNCIPAEAMVDKFIHLPNEAIREIHGILRYEYLDVSNIKDFRSGDLGFFENMSNILADKIQSVNSKLKKTHLQYLLNCIRDICDKLK